MSDFTWTMGVRSPDLKTLLVEFDFGLTLRLDPVAGSFFDADLSSDDTSYKLTCPRCLRRVRRGILSDHIHCRTSECMSATILAWEEDNFETKTGRRAYWRAAGPHLPQYPKGTVPIWLPEDGVRLTVEKARVRLERSQGNFPVVDPDDLEKTLENHSFLTDLESWLRPYTPTFEALLVAYDLGDQLNDLWKDWKGAKKLRSPAKKLAAFEELEARWATEGFRSRYPQDRDKLRLAMGLPTDTPKA